MSNSGMSTFGMSTVRVSRIADLFDFITSTLMLAAAAGADQGHIGRLAIGWVWLGVKLAFIACLFGDGAYVSVLGIYLLLQPEYLLHLLERLYNLSIREWPSTHKDGLQLVQLVISLSGYAATGAALSVLWAGLRGFYGIFTGERPWTRTALGTSVALGGIYVLLSKHSSWVDLVFGSWKIPRYCAAVVRVLFLGCLLLWERFQMLFMWILHSLGRFQDYLSAVPSQDQNYKQLGPDQIRLLRLSRRFPGARVRASLVNVLITELPAYEAISYVWGDSTTTGSIIIDEFEFPVSGKVYEILHEKSSIMMPRLIWIDWICINQADLSERGQQVGLMRQIYGNASRVTVCLGNPPDANQARWLLFYFHYRFLFDRCSKTDTLLRVYHGDRALFGHSRPENWAALYRLFNNPWFERVWIVQEAVVASKLSMLYGGHYIRWELFPLVLEAFRHPESAMVRTFILPVENGQAGSLPLALENGTLIEAFRHDRVKETLSLHRVLKSCHSFRATDPRDKVFALQGLTDAALDGSLPIDYKMGTAQVFVNTAQFFLRKGQLLNVLPLAGIGWESLDGLPSWVVDWTMNRAPLTIAPISGEFPQNIYSAATGYEVYIIPARNDRSILIRCIDFDSIAQLSFKWRIKAARGFADRSTRQFSGEAQKIVMRSAAPDPYHTGQPLTEALWRTLICDRFEQERPVPKDKWEERFKNMEDMAGPLAQFEQGGFNSIQPVSADVTLEEYKLEVINRSLGSFQFQNAMTVCLERRFAVTEKGYLALVPPRTQVGDRVCAVMGAEVPFLFRGATGQTRQEENWSCELVGECYVHGLMDGEMLGEGYERKMKMFEVR